MRCESSAGGGGTPWPSGTTRLAGVMGADASSSLSPAIHNAAYQSIDADWVYVAFPVPPGGAGAAIAGMRALGIAGLSVTIPHKVEVIAHLDRLTETATVVGAVNTISWDSGELVGDNTDVAGLIEGLEAAAGIPIAGRKVLILGAGGAARAAAWGAATSGARSVEIVARRTEAAASIARDLTEAASERSIAIGEIAPVGAEDIRSAAGEAELIISATPQLGPDDELVDCRWFGGQSFIYDLVYQPTETALVKSARRAGISAESGLGMLIAQAAIQVEIWTGHSPPRATMEAAATAALAERRAE
ncbi:MAG: shikimate dehydrogenase [Acidobacteria bacterium]|nr:MAG: shikimate dehydrogenase [Acidobacteriota bacterium]